MKWIWFLLWFYILLSLQQALFSQKAVPFPEGWESFSKVEDGEVVKGNPLYVIIPGPHSTYLNSIAYEHFKNHIKSYLEGKEPPPFPEGSIIVFVNFEDKERKKPKLILVMHKSKEYGQTGDWGWEGFKPDKSRIVKNPDKDCSNCHYKGTKDWDGAFFSHVK